MLCCKNNDLRDLRANVDNCGLRDLRATVYNCGVLSYSDLIWMIGWSGIASSINKDTNFLVSIS